MPASPTTLLRIVRAEPIREPPSPRVIGIDEWAWRRGRRYGTIIVDLERNRIVDLLSWREVDPSPRGCASIRASRFCACTRAERRWPGSRAGWVSIGVQSGFIRTFGADGCLSSQALGSRLTRHAALAGGAGRTWRDHTCCV